MHISIFGITLGKSKEQARVVELERRLYIANELIRDIAWLTQPDKVGLTIEHKESVIESTNHYAMAYVKRNNL